MCIVTHTCSDSPIQVNTKKKSKTEWSDCTVSSLVDEEISASAHNTDNVDPELENEIKIL